MRKLLHTLILVLSSSFCIGQETTSFSPIYNSKNNPFTYEIWAIAKYSSTITSMGTSYSQINGEFSSVEMGINTYLHKLHSVFLYSLGAGYNHTNIFRTGDENTPNGIKTHWAYLNAAAYVYCGMSLYVSLGSEVYFSILGNYYDNKGFNYVWYNNDCLNKISCSIYWELKSSLTFFSIGLRTGYTPIPILNPDKTAYYTLTKTNVDIFYFAISAEYRLFTQQNKLKRSFN